MMMPLVETVSAQPTNVSLSFLTVMKHSEVESVRSLLQLVDDIEQMECCASKAELRCFIQWALRQSYSAALSADEKLQLLDMSWNVQQLLWAASEN